jgi:cell division protease FtsH
MGGRVAEEVVFGKKTTGAGNDIEKATELARKMVCEWGMSDKMGPLTYGKIDEQIFLGKEIGRSQNYSAQTAMEIDQEIRRIVVEGYQRATELIEGNIETLNSLAEGLLEYETLTADEILRLIDGEDYMTLREHPEEEESSEETSDSESRSYATRLKDEVLKKVRGDRDDDEQNPGPVGPASPQGSESS